MQIIIENSIMCYELSFATEVLTASFYKNAIV